MGVMFHFEVPVPVIRACNPCQILGVRAAALQVHLTHAALHVLCMQALMHMVWNLLQRLSIKV
jgi:hypothetical protein